MAISKFNPNLSYNHVDGGSLDVIATIYTFTINIQASGQHIAYFKCLQVKCGIETPLKIPLHSNIQWGIADGMLGQSYCLQQAINFFICSADKLFGPITSFQHAGSPMKQVSWMRFSLKLGDLEHVNVTCMLISNVNQIQYLFFHEHQAIL
ncbi:hypothetical protein HD554DRAFT_2170590 [Boletus coccyginus]|nr:hypothetical protein HD554DRAFT_2170590 [Boletus coccyginus]